MDIDDEDIDYETMEQDTEMHIDYRVEGWRNMSNFFPKPSKSYQLRWFCQNFIKNFIDFANCHFFLNLGKKILAEESERKKLEKGHKKRIKMTFAKKNRRHFCVLNIKFVVKASNLLYFSKIILKFFS